MEKQIIYFFLVICQTTVLPCFLHARESKVWTIDQATAWQSKQAWIVGCNFIPSTAINELGMWQEDPDGFKKRIGQFLDLADKNKIKSMFVLFDDCWNDGPKPGRQPGPKPGGHKSGWVQCPGRKMHNDFSTWARLESYVKEILSSFGTDQRILLWDLYNEPANGDYEDSSFALLRKAFEWAWAMRPLQPLTAGIWNDSLHYNDWQTSYSDIISFHNYNDQKNLEEEIRTLLSSGRPLICSEYMARTRNSRFQTHLPVFKQYKVGAINWGFVSGKTNTIYQWDKPVPDGSEPKIWFHDGYRKDGSPFDSKEVKFIKQITEAN